VIFSKDWRRKPAIRLMLYVTICDLIGEIFWFISIVNEACPSLGAIEMFGINASSLWMCCVGFNLYHTTSTPNKKLPNELYFHAFCWGISLIETVVAVSIQWFAQFGPPNGCWLSGEIGNYIFYLVHQLFCFLVDLFFMGVTVYRLYQSRINSTSIPLKTRAKVLLLMQCFFMVYMLGIVLQNISSDANSVVFNIGLCLDALTGLLNASAISGFTVWQKLTNLQKGVKEVKMTNSTQDDF